jgi:L-lactate dehydrogenase complex protein LldF
MLLTAADYKIKTTDVIADAFTKEKRRQETDEKKLFSETNKKHFADYDLATKRASQIRWKTIENLDKHLITFEANCIKAGIKILWAMDAAQAQQEVETIVARHAIDTAILHNTTLFDELEFLPFFIANQQISIQHATQLKGDVANKKSLLIQDATFLAAEPCAIITANYNENTSVDHIPFPVKLFMAPIDAVVPLLNDVDLLLSLKAMHLSPSGEVVSSQFITAANSEGRTKDIYVLLVDNGRSNLLENETQRQLLHCIQCSACQTACPVVTSIGNTGGQNAYYGPTGFTTTPFWKGVKEYSYLSYSSPLCGKCNEVCPVRIDFRKTLIHARHDAIAKKLNPQSEKLFYMIWKKTMLKREFMNWNKVNTMRYAVETHFLKSRLGLRKMPTVAEKSFNQQWRERMGMK